MTVFFVSTLLMLLSASVAAAFEEDLIIERRPHHVDWDDLFMEYNRYSAPNRVKQEINITLDVINIKNDKILFELTQTWRDERLRFIEAIKVPVPSHIQPWTPDTYIRDGWDVTVKEKSLDLDYDGTFTLRQKYQASVNWNSLTNELSFVISSFNNYGTALISYNLTRSRIEIPGYEHISSFERIRKADNNHFEDVHILIHTNAVHYDVYSQATNRSVTSDPSLAASNISSNSTK